LPNDFAERLTETAIWSPRRFLPATDPAVDVLDQAEALGDGKERGRRDQVAVVSDHAKKKLVPGRLGHRCADRLDRLGVEHEAVVLEGVADPV
jgi:hypothetical protein